MKPRGWFLPLVVVISAVFVEEFSVWPVMVLGEPACSVLTTADHGDDLRGLRSKTLAAFRNKCRPEKSCSFRTEPNFPVIFSFVLKPFTADHIRVHFTVKAAFDGMIALADTPDAASIFAMIVLGGWVNTKTLIAACLEDVCRPGQVEVSEAALDASEHRPFWVGYDAGVVSLGKGGEQEPALQWDAEAHHGSVPSKIYMGFSTFRAASGEWVFHQLCA